MVNNSSFCFSVVGFDVKHLYTESIEYKIYNLLSLFKLHNQPYEASIQTHKYFMCKIEKTCKPFLKSMHTFCEVMFDSISTCLI